MSLSIESRLDSIPLLGRAVRAACEEIVHSELLLGAVELSVVEAVTNAVAHAYGGRAGHEVVVDLQLAPDGMEIRVTDTGRSLAPWRLERAGSETLEVDPEDFEALPESGFGLGIIKSAMDEVTYDRVDGQNVLSLRKRWSFTGP